MSSYLLPLVALLFSVCANAQAAGPGLTPEQLGFSSFTYNEAGLGEVNYYLSDAPAEEALPLLIYLDGSGPYPLFQAMPQGVGSTVVINFQELRKEYRILLIGKPGVSFFGTPTVVRDGQPQFNEPAEYTERLSLDWRIEATRRALTHALRQPLVDSSCVVMIGYSEGAQVAPFVAAREPSVSRLMLFGGTGLSHLYDPIISARTRAAQGEVSEAEAQATIDSLYVVYADIMAHPEATDRRWYGHTYKRWASFARREPADALVKLTIPIYFANGSLDVNPVLNADYLPIRFLQAGKDNLTYVTYPNQDHQFTEVIIDQEGRPIVTPKLPQALADAFAWLDGKSAN